jgi:hypothetical protein
VGRLHVQVHVQACHQIVPRLESRIQPRKDTAERLTAEEVSTYSSAIP